jgi:hypothetical protein
MEYTKELTSLIKSEERELLERFMEIKITNNYFDWNDMMHLISKIENMGYQVLFHYRECEISYTPSGSPLPRPIEKEFHIRVLDTQLRKINSAYKAILKFIQLYFYELSSKQS